MIRTAIKQTPLVAITMICIIMTAMGILIGLAIQDYKPNVVNDLAVKACIDLKGVPLFSAFNDRAILVDCKAIK